MFVVGLIIMVFIDGFTLLAVMLYMDLKLARWVVVIASALNIIAGAKNFIVMPEKQSDAFLQACFAVLFCIV